MTPEHENFEPLIRENEPTDDESVPVRVRLAMHYITEAQKLFAGDKSQAAVGIRMRLTDAAHWVGVYHATGSEK